MLLLLEKGIRGGECHAIHRHTKANNKYMTDYDPSKESSYLMYWYISSLHMQAILQKLSMNGFEWVENTPEFDEYIIRNYDQDSEVGYIF